MARKRRYRRARSYYRRAKARASQMTIPIAPLIGVAMMPGIWVGTNELIRGQYDSAGAWYKQVVGLDSSNNFNFDILKANWTPLIAGIIMHKVAGRLGVNRALGQAKIPLVRI